MTTASAAGIVQGARPLGETMKKVKVIRGFHLGSIHKIAKPGQVVELEARHAREVIISGQAELYTGKAKAESE